MFQIRRPVFASLLLIALSTLVACGGKTQSKIDSANEDNARLSAIEGELNQQGVGFVDPAASAVVIAHMDGPALDRTRGLLSDFVARARNIITTSQRKDVSVKDTSRVSLVERTLAIAEHLRAKVNEVAARRASSAQCPNGDARAFTSIARNGATLWARGLDPKISHHLDYDNIRVAPVTDSCTRVRMTFPHSRRAHCDFTVVMEQGSVIHNQSDADFNCH